MERSDVLLRITADAPGRLLVLEGAKLTLPQDGVVGRLVVGALGALLTVAEAAVGEEFLWRPRRVAVDRAAGLLTIEEFQVVKGGERSESIALNSVDRLVVRTVYRPPIGQAKSEPPSVTNPRHVEAVVHLDEGAGRRQRRLGLEVLGLDTTEKAADLAYRLGAAMGLAFHSVARSDPRRLEIEMTREARAGLDALPSPDVSADYEAGRVARAATEAARRLVVPSPDRSRFPGSWRITRWEPQDEVRFDRPLEGLAFGCLPVALGGLFLGPGIWLLFRDTAGSVITMLVVVTAVGLLVSAAAAAVIVWSLPQRTRISWRDQSLSVGHALRTRRIPMDRIRALEVQCTRRVHSRGGRNSGDYNEYSCAVRAVLRGAGSGGDVELVTTGPFKSDPEGPYDAALPLARDLAEALGVEFTVTDYR